MKAGSLKESSSSHASTGRQRVLPQFGTGKVLVVEDNEINQQIALEMLAATGLQVDIAENGQAALDKLFAAEPQAYDLLLMDIQMPVLGGHSAAKRIRADWRYAEIPILAMTAHATSEERTQCLQSGMQDLIVKPIDPDEFYQTLSKWLKRPGVDQDESEQTPDVEASTQLPASVEPADQVLNDPDAIPVEIPGFDTNETMDRLGGDVALYHRILAMLLPALTKTLEEFDIAQREDNRSALMIIAHGVLGMGANVGAMALAKAAGELEQSLKDRRASSQQLILFRSLLEETVQALETALREKKIFVETAKN